MFIPLNQIPAPARWTDAVNIPRKSRNCAFALGYRGQLPALRQGCCLQAQTKSAQITFAALNIGPNPAEAHGFHELILGHPVTIIKMQATGRPFVPIPLYSDVRCVRGDTVVQQVRDSRLQRVANPAK